MELGLKILGPRSTGEEKEKPALLCEQCSYPFKTTSALKKHVAAVHERRKDFVCDVCAKGFPSKGNLKYHRQTVHEGIKAFTCHLCGHRDGRTDFSTF